MVLPIYLGANLKAVVIQDDALCRNACSIDSRTRRRCCPRVCPNDEVFVSMGGNRRLRLRVQAATDTDALWIKHNTRLGNTGSVNVSVSISRVGPNDSVIFPIGCNGGLR